MCGKTLRAPWGVLPILIFVKPNVYCAVSGFGAPGEPGISRNVRASADGVNGFCSSATPWFNTP